MTSQDRYRKIGLAARLDLTSLLEISRSYLRLANHNRARHDHDARPRALMLMRMSSSTILRDSFLERWPMSTYRALLALSFIGIASTALGQTKVRAPETNVPAPEMGTPEQRAACGPDVGRFCKSVKPEDGPFAYLSCLQGHREKLRTACLKVLESNGQ